MIVGMQPWVGRCGDGVDVLSRKRESITIHSVTFLFGMDRANDHKTCVGDNTLFFTSGVT